MKEGKGWIEKTDERKSEGKSTQNKEEYNMYIDTGCSLKSKHFQHLANSPSPALGCNNMSLKK